MWSIRAPNAKPRNGANKDCPQAFHALRAAANEKRANDPKRQKSGTPSGSVIGSGRIGPGAALKRQNPHDPSTTRARRDSTRILTSARYSCFAFSSLSGPGGLGGRTPSSSGRHRAHPRPPRRRCPASCASGRRSPLRSSDRNACASCACRGEPPGGSPLDPPPRSAGARIPGTRKAKTQSNPFGSRSSRTRLRGHAAVSDEHCPLQSKAVAELAGPDALWRRAPPGCAIREAGASELLGDRSVGRAVAGVVGTIFLDQTNSAYAEFVWLPRAVPSLGHGFPPSSSRLVCLADCSSENPGQFSPFHSSVPDETGTSFQIFLNAITTRDKVPILGQPSSWLKNRRLHSGLVRS